jgi:hypothetical protein
MKQIFIAGIVALVVCLSACGSSDVREYEKLVDRELASNKRYDSIFLGIYLGMPSKDFYQHCWDLNKQGLITNGSENASVLWKMKEGFSHSVDLNFYPAFNDRKIFKMTAGFNYEGWAPWNKHLGSDSLKNEVLRLYKKWYGENNFVELKDSLRGSIYVKVDGNRRITIGRYDDIHVKVDYTDLLIEKQLKGKK